MIWSCNRRAGKGIAARVPKVLWSSVGVNNSRTSVHATKPDHHWLFHTHRNPRRHELCAPLPNGRRYSRCGYYHRSLHRPALATAERPYLNPYVTCDCRAATEMMERGMKLVVDVPDRVRRRGLSLHRHGSGGGGGGTGCECENKLSASFPTFRSVSAGSKDRGGSPRQDPATTPSTLNRVLVLVCWVDPSLLPFLWYYVEYQGSIQTVEGWTVG